MKRAKSILLAIPLLIATNGLFGQTLSKSIELKYTSAKGTNGCAVTFNPDKNLYYACIAGNAQYPLEVWDEKGISQKATPIGFDAQGLWFKGGHLRGNALWGRGLFTINLDNQGLPTRVTQSFVQVIQPNKQSVGAFDKTNKHIVFYENGYIYLYEYKDAGKLLEKFPVKYDDIDNLNQNSVILTDIKGKEYGLLNHKEKQVLLFNKKGKLKATYSLPSHAITHKLFKFSYANNLVFLYNAETSSWIGYSGLK